MKRFFALILVLCTVLLGACGKDNQEAKITMPQSTKITDSFVIGNYVMTVPNGYTAETSSYRSFYLTSDDGECFMSIYAVDVSSLDESHTQEIISSQEGVFQDDDATIYSETTHPVNFGGVSVDMLMYVEVDTSGYATLNIEGVFTDSWYCYTVFVSYSMDADNSTQYASNFGEFCATAEYTGESSRFDFVQ